MELVLHQKLEQKLLMTFELRQAIELLQYSTFELEQFIREQELENPLIELKEKDGHNQFEERIQRVSSTSDSSESLIEKTRSFEANMRDELFAQAKFMFSDEHTLFLLSTIIYNLDDNGYLNQPDGESMTTLNLTDLDIERGIQILQQFAPLGTGARTLKECLQLQLRYGYPDEKEAEYLVNNHLQLLADRKWNELSALMKIPLAEVKRLSDLIRSLNPRPCTFIADFTTDYLNPDIIVEYINDEFTFHLNDGNLPSIQIHQDYSRYLQGKSDVANYMHEHYKSYQWLLNSIEQRRNTIISIMHVLLEKQKNFFLTGFQALEPLTLKEVADEIGMHESTVSRATANKVIQTPLGSFNLRLLFTSKLETTDGSSISQTTVKSLLKSFIDQEDKYRPHSDQKIADYLKSEKGITISRRTISKYREELNIPSSSRRKEIRV